MKENEKTENNSADLSAFKEVFDEKKMRRIKANIARMEKWVEDNQDEINKAWANGGCIWDKNKIINSRTNDEWSEKIKDNLITWNEFALSDIPDIEWVIQAFVPVKGVCFFAGDSGSMKSYLALFLSYELAQGKALFGKFKTKRSRVLYIDEENSKPSIKTRVMKLMSKILDTEEIYFMVGKQMKLDDPIWKYRLEVLIKELHPALIVIDSMVRFLQGDENSSRDVKKVFETIKEMMNKYEVSFLILHHTTKLGSFNPRKHSMRGSGDFSAFSDTVNMISKKGNTITVRQEKNRHMEPVITFNVEIIDKDDGGIDMRYKERNEESKKPMAEQCAEDIRDWMDENKITELKTQEAKKQFYKNETNDFNYSHNAINDALQSLVNQGFLVSKKRGEFIREKKI